MIQYFPSKCHWSIFKFIIEKDRSWKLFQRPASQEVIVCIRWAESSWGREVIKTKQLCAIDAYQIKTTVFILYLISYTFILYNKHQHITTLNPLTGEVTHTDDLFTLQCSSGSWVDITYTVLLRYHPPKNWRRTRAGSDGLTVPSTCDCTGFSAMLSNSSMFLQNHMWVKTFIQLPIPLWWHGWVYSLSKGTKTTKL